MNKLSVSVSRTEMILGLCYIPLQLLVIPVIVVIGNLVLGNPFSDVQVNFVLFCIDFICVTVIFHKFLLRSLKLSFTMPWRIFRFAGLGFLLYWAGNFVINFIIIALNPDFTNVNNDSIAELTQQNYSLMAVSTVLLVPITEETIYRGVVFGKIYERNPIAGYIVSVAIFSALHVVGYIGSFPATHLLMCFLQYIPAGIALAWAYTKADSIWAPILMHIAINQVSILAMR